MSMFGSRKSGPSKGPEWVLAYLVDVQLLGAPLRIEDAHGREVPVTLDLISERRATLTFFEALDLNQVRHGRTPLGCGTGRAP